MNWVRLCDRRTGDFNVNPSNDVPKGRPGRIEKKKNFLEISILCINIALKKHDNELY